MFDMDYPEILKFKVNRDVPLSTGEPIEKLAEERELE